MNKNLEKFTAISKRVLWDEPRDIYYAKGDCMIKDDDIEPDYGHHPVSMQIYVHNGCIRIKTGLANNSAHLSLGHQLVDPERCAKWLAGYFHDIELVDNVYDAFTDIERADFDEGYQEWLKETEHEPTEEELEAMYHEYYQRQISENSHEV